MPRNHIKQNNQDDNTLRKTLMIVGAFAVIGVASGGIALAGGMLVGGAIAIGAGVFFLLTAGAKVTAMVLTPEIEQVKERAQALADENSELNKKLQESLSQRTSLSTYAQTLKSQQQGFKDEINLLKQDKVTLEESLVKQIESEQIDEIQLLDEEEANLVITPTYRLG